jgi:4-amino-4-deoxy-L-arabinose transferase-like glycosyltransferase
MRAAPNLTQPRLGLGLMAVVLTVAFLCRFYPLHRGLGQDELYTAVNFVEAGSIRTTMFSNSAFNNHIGYSLMARMSNKLFGHSEWALRLPAVLLGIASLYLFWIFSQSMLTFSAATIGTLVLALSPPHVIWSVEARGYSSMVFFAILSSYLYLRLLRRPTRRAALWYIVANVGGIYVHLYSVFVIGVQILMCAQLTMSQKPTAQAEVQMTPKSSRLLWLSFTAIAILSLIAYVPVAQPMLNDLVGRGHGSFNPAFPWTIIQQLSGSERLTITLLVAGTALLGWYSLSKSRPFESRYFTGLIIVPVSVMWLARPFDLYPRFFAYWLPCYIIFFVAGIGALWHLAPPDRSLITRFLPRAAAAVILFAVLYHWTASRSQYIPDEGYREASAAALLDADDAVRYCAIGGARSVWRYYIHQPIAMPTSIGELQELGRMSREVRCVYYEATWQSREQTEIAKFLLQHADWQMIKSLTVFKYQAGYDIAGLSPRYNELSGR